MHLIRAIAFATAAAAGRVTLGTAPLDMSNTSWWRLALAAPAISPDFALVSKHVCERGSIFGRELKVYFPSDCGAHMISSRNFHGHQNKKKAKGLGRIRARRLPEERMIEGRRPRDDDAEGADLRELVVLEVADRPRSAPADRLACATDGLGHIGTCVVEMIADRRGPPGARYFQEYVSAMGAYLRDVDGLYDGFAPSLYCHERDWLDADRAVTSICKQINGEQECTANTRCAWKEKTNECVGKPRCKLCRWPTGNAVFRDHFECFVAPPFDEWFGFDALPPADDPGWGRRAAAKAYAAVDRDALVDCGAADGELRVVVHVRLGDLIHPDLSVNASATAVTSISMRSQGGQLQNALRVVAGLRARLPGRRVHTLILSDSPPETVAATLEGLDVGISVGGARRDGASHLVDGRTAGLENGFDVSFHGAGNPLVALHCMAAADLLLGPERCGDPWPKTKKKTSHPKKKKKRGHRRLGRLVTGSGPSATLKRCSSMVKFARELSLRGVYRGLPVEPLDATAVDAGVEALLGSGALV